MKELQKGIIDEYKNTAALVAVVSNFYYYSDPAQERSATPEFPFCAFRIINSEPSWVMGKDRLESLDVRFHIVSDETSSVEVSDIFKELIDCFDFAELTVSGYNTIYCKRIFNIPDRLDTNPKTWQYTVDYRILLEEQ